MLNYSKVLKKICCSWQWIADDNRQDGNRIFPKIAVSIRMDYAVIVFIITFVFCTAFIPSAHAVVPDTPSNSLPADGAANVSLNPILSASVFVDNDPMDSHQAGQWQISTVSNDYSATNLVYDSGAVVAQTNHTVAATLAYGTVCYWRVRYQDSHGGWSSWSAETSFTTEPGCGTNTTRLEHLGLYYSTQAWGNLTIDGSVYGGGLKINGSTYYTHGIGTHADADLRWNLNRAYCRLTGFAGRDKTIGTIKFYIYVDYMGDETWTLKWQGGSSGPTPFDIDLSGAYNLRIFVDDLGYLSDDGAAIAEPILTHKDAYGVATATPDQPINISPSVGAVDISLLPALTGSVFSDPDNDAHAASRWQIRMANGVYGAPDSYDSGETAADLIGHTVDPVLVSASSGLPSGAVAYWKFDEDVDNVAFDETGHNQGTVNGAVWVTGKSGNALSFDGNDDYVNVDNSSFLQISADQTIEMWIKPSSFEVRSNPFAKAYGGEGAITIENDGRATYYYGVCGGNCSPYQFFRTNTNLEVGVWTHLVLVRDLTNMKLVWYINGEKTNETEALYAAAAVSSLSLSIGKGYVTDTFAGSLDEIVLYNRALSDDEVLERYSSVVSAVTNFALIANTEYYWRLQYQDDTGAWSRWSAETGFTTRGNTAPDTPVAVSPVNETGVNRSPILVSTDFADADTVSYPVEFHRASQWQIRKESAVYENSWPDAYDSSEIGGNLISHTLSVVLDPGVTCFWRVRYQDAGSAWSAWSDEVSFVTSSNLFPNTPVNLSPADGAANISLTPVLTGSVFSDPNVDDTQQSGQWQISADWGSAFAGNIIYDSGPVTDLENHIVSATLDYGTVYYWRLRYQDSQGGWSDYSGETGFTTVPGTGVRTIHLEDMARYHATQAWGNLTIDGSVYGGALKINGTTYTDGLGTHADADIRWHLIEADSRVTGFVGQDKSSGTIKFYIYVDYVGDETWTLKWQGGSSGPSPFDIDLSGAHNLRIFVDDLGYFSNDGAAIAEPLLHRNDVSQYATAPDRPANLSPADGAAGVSLTPTLAGSAFFDPNNDVQAASNWQVRKADGVYGDAVSYAATTTGGITSHDVSAALAYGATYSWHVRYQDNVGVWSAWSPETDFTTENASPPGAPASLTAVADGACLIDLSWIDNSSLETGFKIERKEGTDEIWEQINTVAADVTSYQDTSGFTINTSYYYRVSAYNSGGDSIASNEASAATSSDTYYQDSDEDGYGNAANTQAACSPPSGYVINNTDCDDTNPALNPATVWYNDADSDGYSDGVSQIQCAAPGDDYYLSTDLTASSGDCNDADATLNPATVWFKDADGDDYSDGTRQTQCTDPGADYYIFSDLTAASGDCNDADAVIKPGATEVCDGADNNCDGTIDEGLVQDHTYYRDVDNDTYGDAGTMLATCLTSAPVGYVSDTSDCDDSNVQVNLGATEYCNQIDDDCNGTVDDSCIEYADIPAAPSGLIATAQNSRIVKLDWIDNAASEDGFELEIKLWNGEWVLRKTTEPMVTTFTDVIGIMPSTEYSYRVRTYKGINKSAYSSEVTLTTPAFSSGDNVCE